MKRLKKQILRNLFGVFGAYPADRTKQSDLVYLLKRLQPQITDAGLIRLGPKGDGGYLVPDALDNIAACFSPGVDRISGFEIACAERGMKVFMADKSVDGVPDEHEKFSFEKKFIGLTTNDDFMTLDDWVDASMPGSDGDLLLQMDIEGAEYEVFLGVSDQLLRRLRIMVVEFHGLQELWNKPYFQLLSTAFEKILQTHICVHNHPNNCCGTLKMEEVELPLVTELTFLRKDYVKHPIPATIFPHPLDGDNTPNKPTLPLPDCWYKSW